MRRLAGLPKNVREADWITAGELAWFPFVVFVQLLFTLALALVVSALTVHFRDIRDILGNLLTFWFFTTPIIYPMSAAPESFRWALNLNPMTHLAISFAMIFGGSPLIENMFLYPGVGYFLNQAIARRDYLLMQGMFLIITVAVVLANLISEMLYTVLDPRLRTEG